MFKVNDEIRQAWMQVCAAKTEYDDKTKSRHNKLPEHEIAKLWKTVEETRLEFELVVKKYYTHHTRASWDHDDDGCGISVKTYTQPVEIYKFFYSNPLVLS